VGGQQLPGGDGDDDEDQREPRDVGRRLPDGRPVAPDASFPADTSDGGGAAQTGASPDPAGQMFVAGLRLTTQDGYDRLVIELDGHGVPAWSARYTEATGPGGGPVDIDGDVFLRVQLQTGPSRVTRASRSCDPRPGRSPRWRRPGSSRGPRRC
jgi:hypothetical protein